MTGFPSSVVDVSWSSPGIRARYREAEKRAWVEYKVRGFVLTGRKSQATGKSLEILERHWGRIIAVVEAQPDGPWMRAVTDSGMRPIDLG